MISRNFKSKGKVYLVQCPKCSRENWAGAVISGQCSWCGYDANKDEGYKKLLKEEE